MIYAVFRRVKAVSVGRSSKVRLSFWQVAREPETKACAELSMEFDELNLTESKSEG